MPAQSWVNLCRPCHSKAWLRVVGFCICFSLHSLLRKGQTGGIVQRKGFLENAASSSPVPVPPGTATAGSSSTVGTATSVPAGSSSPVPSPPATEQKSCTPPAPLSPAPVVEDKPNRTLPLVDFLCKNCKLTELHYAETGPHLPQQINAKLLLVEKACLVRRVTEPDRLFLHSFVASDAALQKVALQQADSLTRLFMNQKNVPALPPFSETLRQKHIYPGFVLNSTLSKHPDSPEIVVGRGGWRVPAEAASINNPKQNVDSGLGEMDMVGASTPFAGMVFGVYRWQKSDVHRPTIIVNTHFFGHFYHTMGDLIVPLFTTLKYMGWQEADVWAWKVTGLGSGAGP